MFLRACVAPCDVLFHAGEHAPFENGVERLRSEDARVAVDKVDKDFLRALGQLVLGCKVVLMLVVFHFPVFGLAPDDGDAAAVAKCTLALPAFSVPDVMRVRVELQPIGFVASFRPAPPGSGNPRQCAAADGYDRYTPAAKHSTSSRLMPGRQRGWL